MIEILYKDNDITVCQKPVGVSSESEGLVKLLSEQLGNGVYPVHRLDTGVGGVMVYALNKKAAALLSADIQRGALIKEYYAVVYGTPSEASGIYKDLLFHDRRRNKSFAVERMRSGVKEASLEYSVKGTQDGLSLVAIKLHTGRTHQIRVQFSSRKTPLYGDGKYGGRNEKSGIALFSRRITLTHPTSGKLLCFEAMPKGTPWDIFPDTIS